MTQKRILTHFITIKLPEMISGNYNPYTEEK
jgi:hypothetical protein